MAYWDLVQEGINELEKTNRNFYASIYEDGDGYEDQVLVFETSDSQKALENWLWNTFNERGIDISDFDWKYNEDKDWNEDCINLATDDNWCYLDAGFCCEECYKWYRFDVYYANYWVGDGFIVCEECVKENPEGYIDSLVNDPSRANTILSMDELYDQGFEKLDEHYAHGWYGRVDDPQEIYDKLVDQYGYDVEVLFSIEKTRNPFQTDFDVYIRGADLDEDY